MTKRDEKLQKQKFLSIQSNKNKKIILDALLQNHSFAFYLIDKDGYLLEANECKLEMVGIPSFSALIGRHVTEIANIDLWESCERVIRNNRVEVSEEPYTAHTGEKYVYLSIKSPLHNEKGQVIGLMGIFIDITSVQRLEDSTEQIKESILETIVQNFPINFYWLDREGVVRGCNENQLKEYEYNNINDFVGKSCGELTTREIWENSKAVMENDLIQKVEEAHVKTNGEKITYLSIKSPLHNRSGIVSGLVGVSIDITERKRMEEELQKANNAKDDFLRNMQHDLHTPVSHIVGITNILKDNFQNLPPEKTQALLNRVNASSKALMVIIDEITAGFDVETGRIPSQTTELNLKEIIQSLKDLLIHGVEQKGLELVIEYDEKIPSLLLSDRVRLHRVLLNLLSNAIKFTSRGIVKISVELVKRTPNNHAIIKFCVQDSGIGIPKEKFSLLFQKFSRLHQSDSGQYPGRGLGLWIVDQFVKELGGEISVDSIEGKGTTFICLIPLRISVMDESYGQVK